jgi:hypothetical protein
MVARKLKIGLLGCGTVGGGLVELVGKNSSLIRQRAGVELSITRILVRDPVKDRPGVGRSLLTTQPEKVLDNDATWWWSWWGESNLPGPLFSSHSLAASTWSLPTRPCSLSMASA